MLCALLNITPTIIHLVHLIFRSRILPAAGTMPRFEKKKSAPKRGPSLTFNDTVPSFLRNLTRAALTDVTTLTRRVALTATAAQLRGPSGLENAVLRHMLHRPFESAQGDEQLRVVVRIDAVQEVERAQVTTEEVHLVAEVTFATARMQAGITAGVAEPSPFTDCLQVRLKDADGEDLRITARCMPREPVNPGDTTLIVVESGCFYCLSLNSPAKAPGWFSISTDVPVADPSAPPPSKKRRTSKKDSEMAEPCIYVTYSETREHKKP